MLQKKYDPDSVAYGWADDTKKTICALIDEGINFRARGCGKENP